jgi:hypothetical protein
MAYGPIDTLIPVAVAVVAPPDMIQMPIFSLFAVRCVDCVCDS